MAVPQVTPALDRPPVEALSERLQEPRWMREVRLAALELAGRLPAPSPTEETWRRTDPAAFELRDVRPDPGAASGPRQIPALPRGVIFAGLPEAVRAHPDLVQEYFMRSVRPEESRFRAMHAACWTGGTFLYVPENVEVTVPLVSEVWIQSAGVGLFPHTLVVAERGSRVTLLDGSGSMAGPWRALVNGVVELIVKDGAAVRYIARQDWLADVSALGVIRGRVGRDAALHTLLVGFGGTVVKTDVESLLEGPGGSSEMLGAFFATGRQRFEVHTLQEHRAPSTLSDLLYKNAVRDSSRSVFSGMIRVHQGAQKTNAFQANRNLILSPGARADSIPNLEIMANDLRCTHGSATSRLNEEHLFYLMSRGLSRVDAVRMVVEGFFAELLDRVPLADVREAIAQDVDRKMVQ